MPANSFSKETKVANELKVVLSDNSWTVIQLVSPGGQAHFSITFFDSIKAKTVFPDLIAYKKGIVLVGEIKAGFDSGDKNKLIAISDVDMAMSQLKDNIRLRLNIPILDDIEVVVALIHAEQNTSIDPEIDQIVIIDNQATLLSINNNWNLFE